VLGRDTRIACRKRTFLALHELSHIPSEIDGDSLSSL